MTTEERFQRIEHVTAGLVEQFKQEREENRKLWRETQKTMADGFDRMQRHMDEGFARVDAAIEKTNATLERSIQESRDADKALGDRISAFVSAMGEYIARPGK